MKSQALSLGAFRKRKARTTIALLTALVFLLALVLVLPDAKAVVGTKPLSTYGTDGRVLAILHANGGQLPNGIYITYPQAYFSNGGFESGNLDGYSTGTPSGVTTWNTSGGGAAICPSVTSTVIVRAASPEAGPARRT